MVDDIPNVEMVDVVPNDKLPLLRYFWVLRSLYVSNS